MPGIKVSFPGFFAFYSTIAATNSHCSRLTKRKNTRTVWKTPNVIIQKGLKILTLSIVESYLWQKNFVTIFKWNCQICWSLKSKFLKCFTELTRRWFCFICVKQMLPFYCLIYEIVITFLANYVNSCSQAPTCWCF